MPGAQCNSSLVLDFAIRHSRSGIWHDVLLCLQGFLGTSSFVAGNLPDDDPGKKAARPSEAFHVVRGQQMIHVR